MSENGFERQDGASYSYRDTAAYQQLQDRPSPPQETPPDQSAQQLFQLPSERFAQGHPGAGEGAAAGVGSQQAVTVVMPFDEAGEFLTYYEHCAHAPGEALGKDITITATMPQGEVRAFRRFLSQLPPIQESASSASPEQLAQEQAAYQKKQNRLLAGVIIVFALLFFVVLPFSVVFIGKVTS